MVISRLFKNRICAICGFSLCATFSYAHEIHTPATQLESLMQTKGALMVNGSTLVGTIEGEDAYVSVEARETFRVNSKVFARGVSVTLLETKASKRKQTAFIDADEIDSLLSALQRLAVVYHGISPLEDFEMVFHSKGDLRISAFNTADRRISVQIAIGAESPVTGTFRQNDLVTLRTLITRAQLYL